VPPDARERARAQPCQHRPDARRRVQRADGKAAAGRIAESLPGNLREQRPWHTEQHGDEVGQEGDQQQPPSGQVAEALDHLAWAGPPRGAVARRHDG
jgi:hypothetical protein